MSFQCDYCKNTFTSKGNLDTHQKKALYCIEKRGLTITDIPSQSFPVVTVSNTWNTHKTKPFHQTSHGA